MFLFMIFVIFLIISTFTPIRYFLPSTFPHRYCADSCGYWTYEKATFKDRYADVRNGFEAYKTGVNKPHLVLHRRFAMKWWQIWNWFDYATHPRWRLPYAERDEDT